MIEANRNKVIWRARRGLLELDLMLQRFLEKNLHTLDEASLFVLYELLLLPDLNLLALCYGTPDYSQPNADNILLQKILCLIREA